MYYTHNKVLPAARQISAVHIQLLKYSLITQSSKYYNNYIKLYNAWQQELLSTIRTAVILSSLLSSILLIVFRTLIGNLLHQMQLLLTSCREHQIYPI